jgi:hypothetical protein
MMVLDLQVKAVAQRKGLAKYMMTLMELVARKENMHRITVPLVKGNAKGEAFWKSMNGFAVDEEYGEDETQAIFSKNITAKKKKKNIKKGVVAVEKETQEKANPAAEEAQGKVLA